MFAGIKEDIKSVFERDPAARSAFEVLTNYQVCMPSGGIE